MPKFLSRLSFSQLSGVNPQLPPMLPPIAITLTKVLLVSPPHYPPPPFLLVNKASSRGNHHHHGLVRIIAVTPPITTPPPITSSGINKGDNAIRVSGRGSVWMRTASGHAATGAGERGILPARKWAGGGLERERETNGWDGGIAAQENHVMGSLHHHHDDEEEEEGQSSRLLTVPTMLTLGRVAAIPLLVLPFYIMRIMLLYQIYQIAFYMDSWWATTATTSIFLAAAITDWLDGYIARKMRLGTVFGAFLDPVADKLMVAATLILLCTKPLEVPVFGHVPWLLAVPSIAIIGREITMSAVREWAASQNSRVLEAVAVNNLGKWKTATQMTALTILLATRDSSLSGRGVLVASGVVLLSISSGLAILSLAVYIKNIWRVLLK